MGDATRHAPRSSQLTRVWCCAIQGVELTVPELPQSLSAVLLRDLPARPGVAKPIAKHDSVAPFMPPQPLVLRGVKTSWNDAENLAREVRQRDTCMRHVNASHARLTPMDGWHVCAGVRVLQFPLETLIDDSMRVSSLSDQQKNKKRLWTLRNSVFKPRQRTSDAKDFYDNDVVFSSAFEKDWSRLTGKDRFKRLIKSNSKKDKRPMEKVRYARAAVHEQTGRGRR